MYKRIGKLIIITLLIIFVPIILAIALIPVFLDHWIFAWLTGVSIIIIGSVLLVFALSVISNLIEGLIIFIKKIIHWIKYGDGLI